MAKDLGLSKKTVYKAISNLEHYGLLSQERQGLNKPNKIFLSTVDAEKTLENCGEVKFTIQEGQNLPPNKTNINETKEKVCNMTNAHSGGMCKIDKEPYSPPTLPSNDSVFKQADSHGNEWAEWALGIVNNFIDNVYPKMTGCKHPQLDTLSKARRMSFALKILDCMDKTSANSKTNVIDAMNFVIKNRHSKYDNIDPTIFWLTSPSVIGYGVLSTHEDRFTAVMDTDYQAVGNVY